MNAAKVIVVMDTYGKNQIKEMTQRRRGVPGRRIIITNKIQAMPKAGEWDTFLASVENKMELINSI